MMLVKPANYIHIDGITKRDSVAMNIKNHTEARAFGLATPDYKFHWGFAILGFVTGLAISAVMLGGIFILLFPYGMTGVEPPTWMVAGMVLGLVVAVVLPFIFGVWFWKIDRATD